MTEVQRLLIPEVEVELGGVSRKFRLDFNAYARMERATGRNLLMEKDWIQGMNMENLLGVVWALLFTPPGEERPTPEEVGSWLGPAHMPVVIQMLTNLHAASNPKPKPGDKGKGRKGGAATPFPVVKSSG